MAKIAKLCVKRDLCIGAASCLALSPKIFELDAENKAVLIRKAAAPTSEVTDTAELAAVPVDDGEILLAAQSCPTKAIFLYDEAGKQVYPEA